MIRTALLSAILVPCLIASAIDEEHRRKGQEMADRAIAYLRTQQDATSGGWSVNPDGPDLPAITGLIVTGMAMDRNVPDFDPALEAAVGYMLSFRQPDGGIYDGILPSYNTSICLSALAKLSRPEHEGAIAGAQHFVRSLQYWEGTDADSVSGEAVAVDRDHPFYGGIGYGRHGRPDGSNLNFALQALQDSGVPGDDPFVRRALVFLSRVQMLDSVNDMPYADGATDGGFVYATSTTKDTPGDGQSQAGTVVETLDDGTVVSRLRSYGSMTYAGFKSYLYADLERDDPRVLAALDWIRANYTLRENPGLGADGLYYYFVTFGRALDSYGPSVLEVAGPDGEVVPRDWENDLIDRLAELQNEDGSFRSVSDRWMENNPVLITAYALLALEHALN